MAKMRTDKCRAYASKASVRSESSLNTEQGSYFEREIVQCKFRGLFKINLSLLSTIIYVQ